MPFYVTHVSPCRLWFLLSSPRPSQDVDAGDGLRVVHVVGKKHDVKHCALLIQLKTVSRDDTAKIKELSTALEEFQVRPLLWRAPLSRTSTLHASLTPFLSTSTPNPPTSLHKTMHTSTMKIPAEHVGRVIGKSGQTIRQIQELSGAQIDLPRDSEPGENFRVLTVTGTEAEVAYCNQLLRLKITPREQGGAAGPGPSFAVRWACGVRGAADRGPTEG